MIAPGAHSPGATPLSPEDVAGLKLSWVSTQEELNEAEARNILAGRSWAFRRRGRWWYLSAEQLGVLHRRMLGDVWRWAGQLRRRETNIGIAPHGIAISVRDLCDDVVAQVGDGDALAYPPDELAIRFHHRLVSIHPFPNGNGRHARLATDLLVHDLGREPFSWGNGSDLVSIGETRSQYLRALRTADRDLNYELLLEFARAGQ
jgi:Fic-DOC domain mobile mystery protein B